MLKITQIEIKVDYFMQMQPGYLINILELTYKLIMKRQVSSKDLETAIILAVGQFFKKKFYTVSGEQRKFLNWEDLLTSPNINRLLMTKKSVIAQGQKQAFLASVKQALANHPLYSVLDVLSKKKEKLSIIKRNCIYENIKNHQLLVSYVCKRYIGTLVDDELLNFSYKQVGNHIETEISQNVFVKMCLNNKNDRSFYIFPNLEEHIFKIKDFQTNDFQRQYLEICKQFGKQQQRVFQSNKKFQIELDMNENDPNYRLPNFLELKKQWKIKQQLKLIAKLQQDRKASIKEKEDLEKQSLKAKNFD